MLSDEKAEQALKEGRVFLVNETEGFEYYLCKGTKEVYEVKFDKIKGIYTCPCPNIRLVPCYHIKSCQLYKVRNSEKKI